MFIWMVALSEAFFRPFCLAEDRSVSCFGSVVSKGAQKTAGEFTFAQIFSSPCSGLYILPRFFGNLPRSGSETLHVRRVLALPVRHQ
jgi:hypothetical protein